MVSNAIRKLSTISVGSFRSGDYDEGDGPVDGVPDLEESTREVINSFDLFFANEYDEALAICDKWAKHSVIHSMGSCFMTFLPAFLTFEGPAIELAKSKVRTSLRICNKRRKKSSMMKALSSFFATPDYNCYTDEEALIEVFVSHAQVMLTMLTFFGDQNLLSLLKGAFRMRAANNGYKKSHDILKHRTQWTSDVIKMNFESGVYTGLGLLGLVLSHLPAKVLKIVALAGFEGDRNAADDMLRNVTTNMKDSLSYKTAEYVVVLYNLYMEQVFGVGSSDLSWAQSLIEYSLAKCPHEAFNLFFLGRLRLLKQDPVQAIEYFNKSIDAQDKWKQIHYICFWDLCWCYAMQSDWENAMKYARILKENSKWSPATNMYQVACFLHMKMEETGNTDLKPEILKAMQTVPELKLRFAGKTSPPEKFAVTKALQYLKGNEDITLPVLELFYIWNVFGSCPPALLKHHLEQIERKLVQLKEKLDDHVDGYCLCLLLKGVALRLSGQQQNAINCFEEVITNQTKVTIDTYIPPQAALELGLTHLELNNYAEAREWLEKARDKYSGFVAETLVHLRVHGALAKVKKLEAGPK